MESRVTFHRQQNISGASQRNSVVAFCLTTEAAGDHFFKCKGKKRKKAPSLMSEVIQGSKSSKKT